MDEHYPHFFARFYDLLYAGILSDGTNYYIRKILEAKGPVLEAGVGTGRIFIEALAKGADIYGIDISGPMLDILRSKMDSKDHSRISLRDIRDFKADRKFKLVISPFRVFMHMNTIEDQLSALDNVYESLEEGGSFIFDVFVPNPSYLANGIQDMVDFEGEYKPGEKLRRITSADYNLIDQMICLDMRFEWKENGRLLSETWKSTMRFFFRYELELLLGRSKFRKWEIFGGFNECLLAKDSKEFVIVCRK